MADSASSVTGLISGIDYRALVDAIIAAEHQPADAAQKQIDLATSRKAALQTYRGLVDTLRTTFDKLRKGTGLDTLTATINGAGVGGRTLLSATASSTAQKGSYEVEIVSLARAAKLGGTGVADPAAALGQAGDFTLNGVTVTVGATDTLSDVRDKINATNTGLTPSKVSASILTVGPGESRLILTSTVAGSAGIAACRHLRQRPRLARPHRWRRVARGGGRRADRDRRHPDHAVHQRHHRRDLGGHAFPGERGARHDRDARRGPRRDRRARQRKGLCGRIQRDDQVSQGTADAGCQAAATLRRQHDADEPRLPVARHAGSHRGRCRRAHHRQPRGLLDLEDGSPFGRRGQVQRGIPRRFRQSARPLHQWGGRRHPRHHARRAAPVEHRYARREEHRPGHTDLPSAGPHRPHRGPARATPGGAAVALQPDGSDHRRAAVAVVIHRLAGVSLLVRGKSSGK